MTEKTLNGIEMGITTALSIGVDYVLDKTITKAINPQTIPEKIITGIGIGGVNLACNYGVYKVVHGILHPEDRVFYEKIIDEYNKRIEENSEVARLLAERQVKVEDAVGDIYKKIMEGKVDG